MTEAKDDDDRHRLAMRRVSIPPKGTPYLLVVGSAFEPTDEELESLRDVPAYVNPFALMLPVPAGGRGGRE